MADTFTALLVLGIKDFQTPFLYILVAVVAHPLQKERATPCDPHFLGDELADTEEMLCRSCVRPRHGYEIPRRSA